MKLKRPLSANQIVLATAAALVAICYLKVEIVRAIEYRRLRTPPTYTFPNRELAELDRLLQARFAVVPDNDFGLARVGARHEIFKPITPAEIEVIDTLRHKNQAVVFYVAGRNYLRAKQGVRLGVGRIMLQGPVFITKKPPLEVKATQTFDGLRENTDPTQPSFQTEQRPIDLPTEEQLVSSLGLMLISNSNIDHTATPDGKTFRAGDWQVAAVPVRATDQACINCHFHVSAFDTNQRLGDPLGIALYAFRPTRGQPPITESVSLPPALPSQFPPERYRSGHW